MTVTKESLQNMFEALLSSRDKELEETYKEFLESDKGKELIKYAKDGDAEKYYLFFSFPFNELSDHILRTAGLDGKLQFIFNNYNYVNDHYEKIIRDFEGDACCYDKSSHIVRMIIRFLITGKKMENDPNAEYTYHHTKNVFLTHDDIYEHFVAILQLYHGDFKNYLQSLKQIGDKS